MKGLETMTAAEGREVIREIMGAYDDCRRLWVKRFDTDDGFNDWFNRQNRGLEVRTVNLIKPNHT